MTDKTTNLKTTNTISLNEDSIKQNNNKNGLVLANHQFSQNNDTLYRMDKYKKRSDSPNFLIKLYQILESPEYEKIIHWSDDGKSFIVENLHDFTEYVLPKYFKHNNYSSFIRQLNMYDFHKQKSSNTEAIFQHQHFLKNDKDSLKLIKRKNKKDNLKDNLLPQQINTFNGLVPFSNTNNFNDLTGLNPNNFNLNFNNKNNSLIEYNQRTNFLPMGNINNINNNNINNNNNLPIPMSVLNLNKKNEIPNVNINSNNDKKITKKSLQKLLLYLMENVDRNTEKQKYLEEKIDNLAKKNEEVILQNQQMINEIISKSEYNNKLETIVRFILGVIMNNTPKKKANIDLKNILTDNNINTLHDNHSTDLDKIGYVNISPNPHDINRIIPSNDFLQNNGYNDSFQVFLNKYMDHAKNTCLLPNKDNNNQYLTDNNINNLQNNNNNNSQNNNENNLSEKNNNNDSYDNKRSDSIDSNESKNQKSELPLSPILSHKKRNRSGSFNTILSNGSNNMSYEDFLKMKNLGKNDTMSVNDLMLNGNNDINNSNANNLNDSNSNKNFFDLDLNDDYKNANSVNGNKDSLNNSQISFNDLYNNNQSNLDKDSDIFYDGNI